MENMQYSGRYEWEKTSNKEEGAAMEKSVMFDEVANVMKNAIAMNIDTLTERVYDPDKSFMQFVHDLLSECITEVCGPEYTTVLDKSLRWFSTEEGDIMGDEVEKKVYEWYNRNKERYSSAATEKYFASGERYSSVEEEVE